MDVVTVRAAAKINLHLGVGAPREDGFHPLTTVYQAIGLCDDVTAVRSASSGLRVHGSPWIDVDQVPTDEQNLVLRAAGALGEHHGIEVPAVFGIEKAIPVAGGLAGGSANAAAALVALDRVYDLDTSDDDLLRIAADLGSDVPFALVGGTALGTGRGEIVEPVADVGTWWWVVVPDREGLSTPEVYRHYDRLFPDADPEPLDAERLLGALRTGQPDNLGRAMHNDLEEAAIDLRPELGRLIVQGEAEGAVRGMVSGSGPTCVFLCEAADHAREVAGALQGGGHEVVLVANGAVAGAHVVTTHA